MSVKYNKGRDSGKLEQEENKISNPGNVPHPINCKEECPYGRNRNYCFPCYKRLMQRTKRSR